MYDVVHVVRQFEPAVGGLEGFVKSLAHQQKKNGLNVLVITLNKVFSDNKTEVLDSISCIEGINVHRLSFFGSYKYPLAFSILKKIREINTDVVHVHGIDFFFDFLSLTKIIHGKKLVASTHGGFFHTNFASKFKLFFFNTITRLSIRNYSAVFACSINDYDIFSKINNNVHLVENGVNLSKFSKVCRKDGNKVLIYVGRFSNNKRLDLLLSFFSKLVAIDDGYKLVIAGRDWDDNLSALESHVISLNLGLNVSIKLNLSDADMSDVIKDASFIVSASSYEGFGLSIVEGMSSGLIPIVSKIDSFKKIISDSNVGLLCDFTDNQINMVDSFVCNVISDFSVVSKKSSEATMKYGWELKEREFFEFYQKVISKRRRVIQGVNLDVRSESEVMIHLDKKVSERIFYPVAFANAHTINLARKNKYFKSILNEFLVLNDGAGINLASKIKYGNGFTSNLNGTDFIPKFLLQSKHNLKVYLIGSNTDVVSVAMKKLSLKYGKHDFVGCHHGFVHDSDTQSILKTINECQPDLILVGMGNPTQEIFIDKYLKSADGHPCLVFGVGALFEFISGNINRAPAWVRVLSMEWIYRLILEPKRLWRRYLLGNFVFMYNAFKDINRL